MGYTGLHIPNQFRYENFDRATEKIRARNGLKTYKILNIPAIVFERPIELHTCAMEIYVF